MFLFFENKVTRTKEVALYKYAVSSSMKVFYIPVIIPDNWKQGLAHLSVLIALGLLVLSFSTTSWTVTEVYFPPRNYFPGQQVIIRNHLRGMAVRRCDVYTDRTECHTGEISFDECTKDKKYCDQAPSTGATFVLIIVAFGLLVVGSALGFVRPQFHWIPIMLSCILVVIAVVVYALSGHVKYNSTIKELLRTAHLVNGASSSNGYGYSFICACVSTALLGAGTVFALLGMIAVRKSGVPNQEVMCVEMTATQVRAATKGHHGEGAGFTSLEAAPELMLEE